ncbi:MAG: valine--tRNA ligase [Phycisphaerae bacterium]|nr:valine--tRNA ligase [Phycisphaerae bacterium]
MRIMSGNVELEKVYNPEAVESGIYALWEQKGCFRAVPDGRPRDQRHVIMIPLPNVTGALHLGHAINNTLQDIVTRTQRMKGKNTLWQPGTDHAGIATQAVVERRIFEEEGKSRHDLGREKLVERIWQWKDQYEKRILSQLKLLGASCDWKRTRFTLDEVCAKAVRHAFFKMFKDGLIFRGKRLVNWDTQLQTAVADDEVYHEAVKGHFWHFKYPVIDPQPGEPEHVLIATTRPETMLADTAVAVHPDPEGELARRETQLRSELAAAVGREKKEIEQRLEGITRRREEFLPTLVRLRDMARAGRKIMLPLVNRPIPLVADEWADPEKGTGCVKITPAHDANDYEVGLRHGLPMVNALTPDGKVAPIIEPDGSLNPHSDRYAGLVFAREGRQRVVDDLEAAGLIDHVDDHEMEVGHSDRSKTPIEPYLSDQWFVRMGDVEGGVTLADGTKSPGLAQAAMDAVTSGRVKIFPERYTKTYLDWLGEKRDWCISRQLWWGHRIPVWHLNNLRLREVGMMPDVLRFAEELQTLEREGKAAHWLWGDPLADFPASMPEWTRTVAGYWCPHPDHEDEFRALVAPFHLEQDENVLDTWFSSQLWPFSTLGWPEDTKDVRYYYPGNVLITSRDIITLWVARMVLSGLYLMGDVPFRHVYIHTKILDGRGEGMSKSKGNGVDPVDIIQLYGADALRYTMADIATELQDVRMPVEYRCPHCTNLTPQTEVVPRNRRPSEIFKVKCKHCGEMFATQWADEDTKIALHVAYETSDRVELGRNLCNKLWNAARFAFRNLEGVEYNRLEIANLLPEDRWVLAELSRVVREVNSLMTRYQFSAMVRRIREFFWDSLCDWYIELTKPRMADDAPPDRRGAEARQVLAFCLDQVLRLFHPIIPYITERLWQQLAVIAPHRGLPGLAEPRMNDVLTVADFPPEAGWPGLDDAKIIEIFQDLQDATRGVRDLRSKCNVLPKVKVTVTLKVPADHVESLRSQAHIIQEMAGVETLHVVSETARPRNSASTVVGAVQILVHDISDDEAERKRVEKDVAGVEKQIAGKESKLANEKFVQNAKPEVVEAERQRLTELLAQRETLTQALRDLAG